MPMASAARASPLGQTVCSEYAKYLFDTLQWRDECQRSWRKFTGSTANRAFEAVNAGEKLIGSVWLDRQCSHIDEVADDVEVRPAV